MSLENMAKAAGHDVSLLIGRILRGEVDWQSMNVADRGNLARQTVADAMKAHQYSDGFPIKLEEVRALFYAACRAVEEYMRTVNRNCMPTLEDLSERLYGVPKPKTEIFQGFLDLTLRQIAYAVPIIRLLKDRVDESGDDPDFKHIAAGRFRRRRSWHAAYLERRLRSSRILITRPTVVFRA